MSQLVEHHSRKAARILDSARELVLDHGAGKITVSEISRAAGVGKGTVYLYWPSKEDLIRGLFARDLLTGLEVIIDRLGADPATVRPHRLAALLLHTTHHLPLALRLHLGDADLLRLLMHRTGDRELFARTQPAALCQTVMPILHSHGLIRHDRPLPDQAYAVHAVLTGFLAAVSDPSSAPPGVGDPYAVLADTVALMVEPPAPPGGTTLAAAAEHVIATLQETRNAVLDFIDRSQAPGQ
ncbi:TetR/AcrR family transcriptional regulator [Streptosporangium sp. NPDC002721]|uniref:TetR/AcrR family transcriptional regulator n=1 Tax=Streptosporangium sp. NPDC002721 TaxID=3366188 RepID=UPI0036A1F5AB